METGKKRVWLLACIGVGLGLAGSTAAYADVHFNGFGQVVVGSTLSNDRPMNQRTNIGDYDADPIFLSESLFGLQAQAALSDKLSATAQIVADGAPNNFTSNDPSHVCVADDTSCTFSHDDFSPRFSWAYATFQLNDDWSIRAGRQRVPLYHYSDYLQVGEAYPWIRPPLSVYSSPITVYDGASINGNFSVGNWYLSPQLYYGEFNGTVFNNDTSIPNTSLKNMLGGVFDATYNDWLELRASYVMTHLSVDYPLIDQLSASLTQEADGECDTPATNCIVTIAGVKTPTFGNPKLWKSLAQEATEFGQFGDAALLADVPAELKAASRDNAYIAPQLTFQDQLYQYASAGFEINKNNFIFDAEGIYTKTGKFISNETAWYASLGYKMGRFTPLITYSFDKTKSSDPAMGARFENHANAADRNYTSAYNTIFGKAPGEVYSYNFYANLANQYTDSLNPKQPCSPQNDPKQNVAGCVPIFNDQDLNAADVAAGPALLKSGADQLASGINYLINGNATLDHYYEAGLRYDLTRNTALKFDYTYYASPYDPVNHPTQGFQHAQLLSAAFTFTF